jgi:hypothetical protein
MNTLNNYKKVLISIDQLLSVKIVHWRTVHFRPIKAIVVVSLLVLVFLLLNFQILILFGHEVKSGDTTRVICFDDSKYPSTKWMSIWGRVSF